MSDGHQHHDHPHDHDHDHAHGHGQDHDHHNHAAHASHRRLVGALVVTLLAMLIGIVGGLASGSLALLADAGHMLADGGSLGLALLASRQALRPADPGHSYGHVRKPVLAAFVNGMLLLLVSGWITLEACDRLLHPQPVNGQTMTLVAVVGFIANVIALALLHGGDKEDLNRRGAAAHVLSDLLGSVAAIIAGLVILGTGWLMADPLLSFLAAALVLRIGLKISRESAHILLEGTPRGLDLRGVAAALPQQVPGLVEVHHVHAWSLSQTQKLMTLHAVPDGSVPAERLIAAIRAALGEHGVTHVTVQVEAAAACSDPDCGHAH
ncbi:MAG: cation diffusion facilitator family transporter [Stagnimonas sp.]|nr:cation diffusion facilitator family transporter [Stagnimonas sp.]